MQDIQGLTDLVLRWICVSGLVYIAAQDLRHFRIPDHATLPLAALGVSRAVFVLPGRWPELLIAGLVAGGVFWLLAVGYARFRGREGLGFGDVKLAAVIGLWLGADTGFAISLGSLLALVIGGRRQLSGKARPDTPIPLGAYLSLGFGFVLLAPMVL